MKEAQIILNEERRKASEKGRQTYEQAMEKIAKTGSVSDVIETHEKATYNAVQNARDAYPNFDHEEQLIRTLEHIRDKMIEEKKKQLENTYVWRCRHVLHEATQSYCSFMDKIYLDQRIYNTTETFDEDHNRAAEKFDERMNKFREHHQSGLVSSVTKKVQRLALVELKQKYQGFNKLNDPSGQTGWKKMWRIMIEKRIYTKFGIQTNINVWVSDICVSLFGK